MKIALLGYGRMGKAIEQIANERGHTIVAKIDKNENQGKLSEAEVAINFSIPMPLLQTSKLQWKNKSLLFVELRAGWSSLKKWKTFVYKQDCLPLCI